mmetsp:Transcript_40031/g.96670  ORF Transcript_40031/g.96670 Transcript_40031/m.96670 type:complete len:102 (-) Transcript_40031:89-394(-)
MTSSGLLFRQVVHIQGSQEVHDFIEWSVNRENLTIRKLLKTRTSNKQCYWIAVVSSMSPYHILQSRHLDKTRNVKLIVRLFGDDGMYLLLLSMVGHGKEQP